MIHPTAIIDKEAKIDPTVEICPYVIIDKDVSIAKNTTIGPYTTIKHVDIDENCKIYQNVCIGDQPQDLKYNNQKTSVVIGKNCIIREFTTIHRGSTTKETKIGDKCYLMAYSHVAHDCILGKEVVFANCATLAGHVQIDDGAIIGGLVAIHQFVRIGKLVMLGGGAMAALDVPPYTTASGDRVRLYGLNLVGLKRNGFSAEKIKNIKLAYKILFRSKLPLTEAVKKLELTNKEKKLGPEIDYMLSFIKTTKRGICREAS